LFLFQYNVWCMVLLYATGGGGYRLSLLII
jgi:hypothetical protein